jgi:hypothetical protein
MTAITLAWTAIEAETSPAGVIRRRIEPQLRHDLFLEQARPSRDRSFVAVLKGNPGHVWRGLSSSRGMGVEVSAGVAQSSIRLVEKDERFASIFDALVADVVSGLVSLEEVAQEVRPLPLDFVAGRIMKWQACLKSLPEGMSPERQAGLFGELSALEQIMATGLSLSEAVASWTGPDRAIQDFQRNGSAVEVKASRQTKPTTLKISSERQLDSSTFNRLFLVHYALDPRNDEAGETLNRRVAGIRDLVRADPAASLAFEDRVIGAGYLDVHAYRYGEVSYAIRSIETFEVRGGFPCIVEADLPTGVGDVSYVLAIAACESYRIPMDEAWRELKGAAE